MSDLEHLEWWPLATEAAAPNFTRAIKPNVGLALARACFERDMFAVLRRRVQYGGRKGRRAARRLRGAQ